MIGITLSGLDQYGTPGFKDALERGQFEKHEVGLLYSEKRMGSERYPDFRLIDRLIQLPSVSLHLCGRAVYDLIGKGHVSNALACVLEHVDRVQLNISRTPWVPKDVAANLQSVNSDMDWIIQFADGTEPLRNCVDLLDCYQGKTLHFLLDASGGRGVSRNHWPEISLPNMGVAGGLTPYNIRDQLILMRDAGYIKEGFWVDTESGIRTVGDEWDWSKARQFVEQVEGFKVGRFLSV